MIELAIYLPKRDVRYVIWIGRGGNYYGQTCWFSLIREEMHRGELVYATMLLPRRGKGTK